MDHEQLQEQLAEKARWATRLSQAADANGDVDHARVKARHVVAEERHGAALAAHGVTDEQRHRAAHELDVEAAVARGLIDEATADALLKQEPSR